MQGYDPISFRKEERQKGLCNEIIEEYAAPIITQNIHLDSSFILAWRTSLSLPQP